MSRPPIPLRAIPVPAAAPVTPRHAPAGKFALGQLNAAPHRLQFFLGMSGLILVSVWWLAALAHRTGAMPAFGAAAHLHPVLMIYGFMPFFIFGFAFTAGPRWLQMPPVPTRVVAWPAWGMLGGLAGVVFTGYLPFMAVYLAGFIVLAWRFAAMARASRAQDKVHAWVVAASLAVGAVCLALRVGAEISGSAFGAFPAIATWGFLVPLFCAVCHRMLPFFTSSALEGAFLWRPWWLLGLLVGAPVLHGLFEIFGTPEWRWMVDLPAALVCGRTVWRWGLVQSLKNRLLAMLHLGFLWLAIGYALFAVQSLLARAGIPALGLAPLHAITIGFLCSLMLAMVTRVTLGHSGRTLAADRWAWGLFAAFQFVAVMRVAAEVIPAAYGALVLAAAAGWTACLVPWGLRNARIYGTPRADGQPG